MRFARFTALPNQPHRCLGDVVASSGVQLLQLDYGRQSAVEAAALEADDRPEFAPAFAQELLGLRKALFLDDDFCVVSNAGWDNALFCVEEAAGVVVESGNPDLLLSAVRGSNLLPILDYLVQDGDELAHDETGQPLKSLREPILAAELELGGGPLAMALADGARIVVAGCYDAASPLCAAGVTRFGWTWSDFNRLSGAAAAAHAAAWPAWHAIDAPRDAAGVTARRHAVEIDDDAAAKLQFSGTVRDDAAPQLQSWIKRRHGPAAQLRHGDVVCDFSSIDCAKSGEAQLSIAGAGGGAADGYWRLNIIHQSGFAAEAMVSALGEEASYEAHQLVDHLRELLGLHNGENCQVAVSAWEGAEDGPQFVGLTCRSARRRPCEEFVADVMTFAQCNRDSVSLLGGTPRVHATSQLWPTRVHRDTVDLAVDTRSAKDWV